MMNVCMCMYVCIQMYVDLYLCDYMYIYFYFDAANKLCICICICIKRLLFSSFFKGGHFENGPYNIVYPIYIIENTSFLICIIP